MPAHWTYDSFERASDLEQGDILAPTEELLELLRSLHPRWCNDSTMGFVIATQSCDLVRRKGALPDAHHIGIAPVKSLTTVLPYLLPNVAEHVGSGVFKRNSKAEAKKFLKRVFDQNEQKLALFYLHPDADIKLGAPSVALLRAKLAIEAVHYDRLIDARTGRLRADFRAKFGWLLGNLYARASTPDWKDTPGGDDQLELMINKHLEEQLPGKGPVWIDDELIEAGTAKGVVFEQRAHDALISELTPLQPKPRLEQAIDAALEDVQKVLAPDAERLAKLRNRLRNTGKLGKLLR